MKKAYSYIGDIKKLIPNGWKFQKLYARNYKAYHKGDIYMFVISNMVLEINWAQGKDQVTIINFILDNKNKPEEFWQSLSNIPMFKDTKFANWCIMDGKIITDKEASKREIDFIMTFNKDNTIPYVKEGKHIEYELVKSIVRLTKIGSVKLCTIN